MLLMTLVCIIIHIIFEEIGLMYLAASIGRNIKQNCPFCILVLKVSREIFSLWKIPNCLEKRLNDMKTGHKFSFPLEWLSHASPFKLLFLRQKFGVILFIANFLSFLNHWGRGVLLHYNSWPINIEIKLPYPMEAGVGMVYSSSCKSLCISRKKNNHITRSREL